MRALYKNIFKIGSLGVITSVFLVVPAFAHVTVKPAEVATAAFTTFTASVPNEKDMPTVELKLLIPENLGHVTPTVKSGWEITTETTGPADASGHGNAKVTSITWSGGEIPQGQRDDFTFSAKTPDDQGELQWRAYQTYADGTVVAWDRTEADQPKHDDGSPDFSTAGPLSVTQVSSKTPSQDTAEATPDEDNETVTAQRALYASIAAVVVALISLVTATKPKK